jgi:hypothetical protein
MEQVMETTTLKKATMLAITTFRKDTIWVHARYECAMHKKKVRIISPGMGVRGRG